MLIKMKTRIYATPAVKGLKITFHICDYSYRSSLDVIRLCGDCESSKPEIIRRA